MKKEKKNINRHNTLTTVLSCNAHISAVFLLSLVALVIQFTFNVFFQFPPQANGKMSKSMPILIDTSDAVSPSSITPSSTTSAAPVAAANTKKATASTTVSTASSNLPVSFPTIPNIKEFPSNIAPHADTTTQSNKINRASNDISDRYASKNVDNIHDHASDIRPTPLSDHSAYHQHIDTSTRTTINSISNIRSTLSRHSNERYTNTVHSSVQMKNIQIETLLVMFCVFLLVLILVICSMYSMRRKGLHRDCDKRQLIQNECEMDFSNSLTNSIITPTAMHV